MRSDRYCACVNVPDIPLQWRCIQKLHVCIIENKCHVGKSTLKIDV